MKRIFDEAIFNIFQVDGLSNRMELIQADIQPLFQFYGDIVSDYVSEKLDLPTKLPVHIAKHIQRSVHPPESTWCAIGGDNRGYKKYPHFQIGINEEYVFFTLAFIDNILHQKEIAKLYQGKLEDFATLPSDIVIIPDHTKLAYSNIAEVDLEKLFRRLETVKSAEFMIGRVELKDKLTLLSEEAYQDWTIKTVEDLLPYYEMAMELYKK